VQWFSKLFGAGARPVRTTGTHPFQIRNPVIGFLNLSGQSSSQLMDADLRALGPLFIHTQTSDTDPPRCDVLFAYCDLSAPRQPIAAPRDLIKVAGAYIAVFASENTSDDYIKRIGKRSDWSANVVMVLNRNGEKFPIFFSHLFAEMFKGRSMLMVWMELAPQGPSPRHADNPSAILDAEAGHITFLRDG
jgi:hypothetical protein